MAKTPKYGDPVAATPENKQADHGALEKAPPKKLHAQPDQQKHGGE